MAIHWQAGDGTQLTSLFFTHLALTWLAWGPGSREEPSPASLAVALAAAEVRAVELAVNAFMPRCAMPLASHALNDTLRGLAALASLAVVAVDMLS